MKYKYDCRMNVDPYVINFLEERKVKYEIYEPTKTLIFLYYSDMDQCEELVDYVKKKTLLITKECVYTKEEMENANWYDICVTRMGLLVRDRRYTYNFSCNLGPDTFRHSDQVNPFVTRNTPKWKNGYNFCALDTGELTKFFCSSFAKDVIIKNDIRGVDFLPVLKGDLKTPRPDVFQLVFKHKLPLEAYTFTGKYTEDVCPICGKRINYIFEDPCSDIYRLNTEMLPKNIDAFDSELTFGGGFGDNPAVISKKFYDVIFKEIKEKPRHFIVYPVA